MAKQLSITHQGREYILEYTRETVAMMERKGFKASDIQDKPMTTLPELFAGAFLANHRFVKRDIIDAIYERLTQKGELIGRLAEMYNEPIMTLIDDPDEAEGNLNWTASW